MSTKDRKDIYKSICNIGTMFIIIILLTWLNGISRLVTESIPLAWVAYIIMPLIISILSIALFIRLIIFFFSIRKARKPETEYLAIFCQSQVGLMTTSLDGSKIIKANPKMIELLGYDNFLEMSHLSATTFWANPAERLNFINQLLINKTVSAYKFSAVRKDGYIRDFEIYATYDSNTGYIHSSIIDITKKQIQEKQLLYQANLLDNIQESIIVIDIKGTVLYHNQQANKLFQITEGQIVFDILTKVRDTYDIKKIGQIFEILESGNGWQGEAYFIVNGEKRIFMNRVDPIMHNNQTKAYVVMSTDITELVHNREKAEAANLAKSQFLANMSHEIRTPMIGILGAVDLLEQSITDNTQLEKINNIRECGEDLLEIINDILDVSKIEIGIINLNCENCNVYDLFYRTINMIEPALTEKGLKLHVDIQAISSVSLYLDPYKLRQVLTNLLFNAIKFTSEGTITLKANIDMIDNNHRLIITIADTGIGIPEDYISYIFDPFYQVDNSNSRNYSGTGLGLYICKRLVELMGGTIDINSSVGKGTKFIISLPIEPPVETVEPIKQVNHIISHDDTVHFIPRSVLVVEDNELNQKIVCEMLKNYGFEVATAKNGLECLQILQNRAFDAILLDMQMPIMDGYETAQLIKKDKNINHIPIIAMTAHAMNGDREKCLASGCTSYIAKPFKAEELVEEIKKHLNPNIKISKHNL
ncbi:MAG: response regulator, partial [Syntrophomonadaceae bacterium]|nr:response regulator [Syntrophomonadaceae bacterium]